MVLAAARTLTISKGKEIALALETEPLIKDLKDIEPLKQALRYVFVLTGLKDENIPEEKYAKPVLLNFIRETFGTYRASEIRIAFELALKKEFEVETNHFQNFSANYLSNVLNAYSAHRAKVSIALQREKEKEKANRELTPEEERNIIKRNYREFDYNVIAAAFFRYKETGRLSFGTTPIKFVYSALEERHKLISISVKDKKELFKRKEAELTKEWEENAGKKATNRREYALKVALNEMLGGANEEGKNYEIQEACRLELVKGFFDEQLKSKKDILKTLKLK